MSAGVDASPPGDGASAHVERYIHQTFGLDSTGLQRVGLFLLAHVLVDTRLIALGLFKAIPTSERRTEEGLRLTDIEEIALCGTGSATASRCRSTGRTR